MPRMLHDAVNYVLGRSPRVKALREAVSKLDESKTQLRASVSKLGEEVYRMVETGDPLRALVHGARHAQFEREIASGETEGKAMGNG